MVRLVVTTACAACVSACAVTTVDGQSVLGARLGTVGAADGPMEETFGEVVDVEVDALGRVYVLDGIAKDIRVFDSSLGYLQTIGREGQGPGEFAGLISAATTDAGVVVIADAGNMRLTMLDTTEVPRRIRESRTAVVPTSVCVIGQRIFAWNNQGDALVSELDPDGIEARQFAARERPTGQLERMLGESDHFLNQGSLACDQTQSLVVLSHSFHPIVRAFTANGDEKWRLELVDYHQQRFRRGPDGRCCIYLIPDPETNTYHVALNILAPGDGFAYLTLRESGPATRLGDYEVRVIELEGGREVARFESTGELSAVKDGRAYVIEPYPVPMVHVHEWSSR